jgi:hypothetical protein
MKLSDLTPDEFNRAATCFHEVGHGLAAVLAGGRIMKIELHDDPDTHGSCSYLGIDHVEHEAQISYAGIYSEARWRFGPHPAHSEISALLAENPSDHEALLASSAGTALYPPGVPKLITTCWAAVASLASRLYGEGSLGHQDVTDALGLPQLDVRLSPAFSMIRMGYAPGSFTVVSPS